MVVVAVVVVIVVVVVQRGTGEGQTRAGRSSDRVFCCVRCWFLTLPVSTTNQIALKSFLSHHLGKNTDLIVRTMVSNRHLRDTSRTPTVQHK